MLLRLIKSSQPKRQTDLVQRESASRGLAEGSVTINQQDRVNRGRALRGPPQRVARVDFRVPPRMHGLSTAYWHQHTLVGLNPRLVGASTHSVVVANISMRIVRRVQFSMRRSPFMGLWVVVVLRFMPSIEPSNFVFKQDFESAGSAYACPTSHGAQQRRRRSHAESDFFDGSSTSRISNQSCPSTVRGRSDLSRWADEEPSKLCTLSLSTTN